MADFRIRVIIDPSGSLRGSRAVNRQLQDIERQARRTGTVLSQALGFVGLAAGIRELVLLTDTLTGLQNRMRLVTETEQELVTVTEQLFDISNRTRTSFEATASIYSRTALAVKDLGLSQKDTLSFTENLNRAVVLSGASNQEATFAMIQLSQGLASGTLRGDELRSVLEQLPYVADIISQHMGVTRGELRLLGEQGQISAETVIEAFRNADVRLEQAFATTVPTITQAFEVLRTEVIRLIGDFNKNNNAAEAFANGILYVANNLDTLLVTVVDLAQALGTALLLNAIRAVTVALIQMAVAAYANPYVALAAGVVVLTSALVGFADKISVSANGLVTLEDLFTATFNGIQTAVMDTIEEVERIYSSLDFSGFQEAFAGVEEIIRPVMDAIKKFFSGIEGSFLGIIQGIARLTDGLRNLNKLAMNAALEIVKAIPYLIKGVYESALVGIEKMVNETFASILEVYNKLSSLIGQDPIEFSIDLGQETSSLDQTVSSLGRHLSAIFNTAFDASPTEDLVNGVIQDARKISDLRLSQPEVKDDPADLTIPGKVDDKLPYALREMIRLLEEERENLLLNNSEREVQNELLAAEEKLRSSTVTLTDDQRALLEEVIRTNQGFRLQAEVLDKLKGPYEKAIAEAGALNQLLADGRIDADQFANSMLQINLQLANLNSQNGEGSFSDGFINGMSEMLEATQNFAAEAGEVFADFFTGVTEGFSDAIAQSILFGDSFTDAVGNAARQALADLLSGLINLGLQYALNAALAGTLSSTITGTQVAQAGALATAYAPAAALASLATSGANAVPAAAGISTVSTLASSVAVPAFADGGPVSGPGGPRDDAIPAMLSNGEFVVNAKSAARFRPQLEAINSGRAYADGGEVRARGDAAPNAASPASVPDAPATGIKVVNVLDPSVVNEFLTTSSGERIIMNLMERNSTSLKQILRDGG
jgi:tape measure domain-containing protein